MSVNTRWDEHFTPQQRVLLDRVQRRFRHHIRTNWNPKGRIRREICAFCENPHLPTEAHHVDYTRPFLVVWVCTSCHRRLEHGSLRVRKRDLWDYSSLVQQKPALQKTNQALAA